MWTHSYQLWMSTYNYNMFDWAKITAENVSEHQLHLLWPFLYKFHKWLQKNGGSIYVSYHVICDLAVECREKVVIAVYCNFILCSGCSYLIIVITFCCAHASLYSGLVKCPLHIDCQSECLHINITCLIKRKSCLQISPLSASDKQTS